MKKKKISDALKDKIHERDGFTCQICGKVADEIIRRRAYEFNPLYEKQFLIEEMKQQEKRKGYPRSMFDIDIFISFEIDHIIPEYNGGPTKKENLRLTCRSCNRSRKNLG